MAAAMHLQMPNRAGTVPSVLGRESETGEEMAQRSLADNTARTLWTQESSAENLRAAAATKSRADAPIKSLAKRIRSS